jgi:hypothetical protein
MRIHARHPVRTALLAAIIGLSFTSIAQAQSVTSQETETVKGRMPTVATAVITYSGSGTGSEVVDGDVLTAEYTVADLDGDAEDVSATGATIQWTVDGANVGALGSKTYTVQAGDAGKTITYKIVPHTNAAITDPAVGNEVIAANIGSDGSGGGDGDIVPESGSKLVSVGLTGNPIVNDTLTATPVCLKACSGVTYEWQLETAVGSGNYATIAGETGATYSPKGTDQRRRIKVVASQP